MNKIPLRHYRPSTADDIPLELLSLDALPAKASMPVPNRHTFHEVFWVTAGRGKHFIDFVEYTIRPNTLFYVKQGCVHYWKIDQSLQGYAVLFQPDIFFATDNLDHISRLDLLQTVGTLPAIYPTATEVQWFQETWQRLDDEYNLKRFARSHAIIALLQLLLIEAQRITLAEPDLPLTPSASVKLATRYQQLVEQKAIHQHKVESYADDLGITLAHLSHCVKEVTGITASEVLRRQLVLEAKRLLAYSNATVAAVAHDLNFADASYFGRYFKRETGKTPREFRSQLPT